MKATRFAIAAAAIAAAAGCDGAAPSKDKGQGADFAIISTNGVAVLTKAELDRRTAEVFARAVPQDRLAKMSPDEIARARRGISSRIMRDVHMETIAPYIAEEARAAGFKVSDEERARLDAECAERRKTDPSFPATFAEFAAKQEDPAKFIASVENGIVMKHFFDEKIAKNVPEPTEKEAQEAIDAIIKRIGGEERLAQEEKEAKKKIDAIKARLDAGEDFATLAKAESDCPSKERGGDLGPFERGKMVPEFDEAAFSAPTGTVTGPVKTRFGWHLIKVTERVPAAAAKDGKPATPETARASHILVETRLRREIPTVKDTIRMMSVRRKNDAANEYIRDMEKRHNIEVKVPPSERGAAPAGAVPAIPAAAPAAKKPSPPATIATPPIAVRRPAPAAKSPAPAAKSPAPAAKSPAPAAKSPAPAAPKAK